MDKLKQFVPKSVWDKVRNAVLFRAEDPNNLEQVLPQMVNTTGVERIKGFRYPAPGSRTGAKVPRTTEDDLYDTNYYKHDPKNLPNETVYGIQGTKPVTVSLAKHRGPTHGKRKITLLPYDPTGLRTTKTTTWAALDKVLAANCKPKHLILPYWQSKKNDVQKWRDERGLPPAFGRSMNHRTSTTANMNEAKW